MINNLGRTQDSIRDHCSTGVAVLATLTGSASVTCGERVPAQHLNSKSFKILEEAVQTVAEVYAAGNGVADRVTRGNTSLSRERKDAAAEMSEYNPGIPPSRLYSKTNSTRGVER